MLKIQLKFPTVPCCFKSNIAEMQKFYLSLNVLWPFYKFYKFQFKTLFTSIHDWKDL